MGEDYEPFATANPNEGVEVGPFEHVENEDGTRTYDQEYVETIDDPVGAGISDTI